MEAMFREIMGKLDKLEQDVSGIKEDVSGIKEDVSGLKQDVSGLKQDVSGLKQDVSNLQKTVTRIEHDHGEKLAALFDAREVMLDDLKKIKNTLNLHTDILKTLAYRHMEHEAAITRLNEEILLQKGSALD